MEELAEIRSLLGRPDLPKIAERLNAALREERERRMKFRQELSPSVKAEFIGGETVMHSPAKARHLRATDNLTNLLRNFVAIGKLGEVFSEKALVCLTRNDYEPDICFFGNEKASQFESTTMEFPAPDFVVEVLSESTKHRDRGVKFDDYAEHGVGEYWIIDCEDASVEQYLLEPEARQFRLARKLTEGEIESTVIPGFRIPVRAIFDREVNQKTLRSILA
ncbi:MAG: Uma2 family endonuclease [Planctomycetota bacterium]